MFIITHLLIAEEHGHLVSLGVFDYVDDIVLIIKNILVVSLDIIRILLRYIIGYFWILLRTNAVMLLGYCVLILAYDVVT